jgi:hypothetical protein
VAKAEEAERVRVSSWPLKNYKELSDEGFTNNVIVMMVLSMKMIIDAQQGSSDEPVKTMPIEVEIK